ncbi:hypothetical protein [Helicobacter pylori]|uniref:hypothetical protein n=1 Tax=Helicobacter pylori TaxID=210 RepID=UPI001FD3E39C|nr:hypothetical protein [Helicobacter pylori]UOS08126.1 hypothetical protein MPG25_04075 [Helicobacter pylori]
MKAILGKHYESYKAVSAQAAFYSLSSALLPETDFYKNKQKFLAIFKAEELLLYKSHFKQLGEFIAGKLLENSRKKIIESNCNKALKMIEKLQKAITTTIDRQINPTIKELKDAQPETYSNLDRSRDKFVSNLNNSVSKETAIQIYLIEKMYTHIDKDIENKECKEIFENECKQRTEKLRENIERCFNECEEQFSKDTKEDIEQFEERIKNSLVMLNHINLDSGFDPNFNIHSGIDKLGLFSSLGGLALLLAVPVLGEFALAAGIVLGAIGVVKSVWSWFSLDYKKSQQRKEVDKILNKNCEIIEEKMRNQLKSYKKIIFEKVESLKAGLNDSVVCYECMREGLIKAGEGLWQISNNIKTRIAQ